MSLKDDLTLDAEVGGTDLSSPFKLLADVSPGAVGGLFGCSVAYMIAGNLEAIIHEEPDVAFLAVSGITIKMSDAECHKERQTKEI